MEESMTDDHSPDHPGRSKASLAVIPSAYAEGRRGGRLRVRIKNIVCVLTRYNTLVQRPVVLARILLALGATAMRYEGREGPRWQQWA